MKLILACVLLVDAAVSLRVEAPAAPATAYLYDLQYVTNMSLQDGYEEQHLIAAVAGLVNRHNATFYVLFQEIDIFWRTQVSAPGQWLEHTTWVNLTSILDIVAQFKNVFRGVVLYDPNIWPTAMLASTASGSEDLLPICYRPDDPTSLYNQLVASGSKLPVLRSFVAAFNTSGTGSVKRNAYEWAINQYLSNTSTTPSDGRYLGYYLDYYWTTQPNVSDPYQKSTVLNHDYFIANRGFMFDLDVWGDEAPNDEPNQPLGSDLAAFRELLQAAYNQTAGNAMIHIGGFTPWAYKYVDAKHGGVPTEWQTAQLVSAYNAYVDADACCIANMANAAFWANFPLPDRFTQNPAPMKEQMIEEGLLYANGSVVGNRLYYMFYVGDYDSAAWLYSQFWSHWNDTARGSVPLGWGVDPELSLRFPTIFPFLYDFVDGE
jgi:hypothetical protein